jgi:hypothetical protein
MPVLTVSNSVVTDPNVKIKLTLVDTQIGDVIEIFRDGVSLGKAVIDIDTKCFDLNDILPDKGTFTYTAQTTRSEVLGAISKLFTLVYTPSLTLPSIEGLSLWMDAADDSTFRLNAECRISSWQDKSSAGRVFGSVTLDSQPTRSYFGFSKPVVNLQDNEFLDLQTGRSIDLKSTNTLFVVGRMRQVTEHYALVYLSGGCGTLSEGTTLPLACSFGSPSNPCTAFQYVAGADRYFYTDSDTISADVPYVVCTRFETSEVFYNTRPLNVNRPAKLTAKVVNPTRIGSSTSLYKQDGEIMEILLYDRTLNTLEIQMITDYLMVKWECDLLHN